MQEMDRRVALLRLLLADIAMRERQAHAAREQLRAQLTHIVDFTVRQNASVGRALSAMDEVEERLAQQDVVLRHLTLLRARTQGELDALLVTRGVADARAKLAELEARRASLLAASGASGRSPVGQDVAAASQDTPQSPAPASGPDQPDPTDHVDVELAAVDAEIAELRALIQQASDAAARSLTGPGV
jgi:hypothetical protein